MTEEKLEQANKLHNNIKKYRNFIKAMNAPYINIIKANFYNGAKETAEIITLSDEPELELFIREYFNNKLDILEQKFRKLD